MITATLAEPGTTTTTSDSAQDLPADFDITKFAADVDSGSTPEKAVESQKAAPAAPDKPAPAAPAKPADKPTDPNKPAQASESPTPDAKPESAFTKAQKEAERRDRSWKALESEKAQFREERAAVLAQVDNLKRELQQLKAQAPAKDEHGATADTYERLAQRYKTEGNDEMAEAAQARADKLRRQQPAATAETPTVEPWRSPDFQAKWKAETDAMMAETPELADPNHGLTKAANALLADKRWAAHFLARPDGIRAAVEVARLLEKSATVDKTLEELKTAKAEIDRLTKLTQVRGSLPAGPNSGPKKLEEMNPDEAAAEVRRIAEAADRGEL